MAEQLSRVTCKHKAQNGILACKHWYFLGEWIHIYMEILTNLLVWQHWWFKKKRKPALKTMFFFWVQDVFKSETVFAHADSCAGFFNDVVSTDRGAFPYKHTTLLLFHTTELCYTVVWLVFKPVGLNWNCFYAHSHFLGYNYCWWLII